MLKIIGAGLSRTGTFSLYHALERLGFSLVGYDVERLNGVLDGTDPRPNFRVYDDVDAVTDIPAAYFYRELFQAYPESKVVLTLRDVEAWWKSIEVHFNVTAPIGEESRLVERLGKRFGLRSDRSEYDAFRRRLRNCVYGSPVAREFLYKAKYLRHNAEVIATIPPDRLLVMDISKGDGWGKLCPFLGVAVPDVEFPRANKTER
jgi:Sulfotransferase domain